LKNDANVSLKKAEKLFNPDPDPHQNVVDLQHWYVPYANLAQNSK
jgi:hypothetical protein